MSTIFIIDDIWNAKLKITLSGVTLPTSDKHDEKPLGYRTKYIMV